MDLQNLLSAGVQLPLYTPLSWVLLDRSDKIAARKLLLNCTINPLPDFPSVKSASGAKAALIDFQTSVLPGKHKMKSFFCHCST